MLAESRTRIITRILARRERLMALAVIFCASTTPIFANASCNAVLTKKSWNGPNEGDIMMWNAFASKLGWRDFATPTLERAKKNAGISDREDIATIPDFIDFDEDRQK